MTAKEALEQMRKEARVTPGAMTVRLMAATLEWADAIEAELKAKDDALKGLHELIVMCNEKDAEIERLKAQVAPRAIWEQAEAYRREHGYPEEP